MTAEERRRDRPGRLGFGVIVPGLYRPVMASDMQGFTEPNPCSAVDPETLSSERSGVVVASEEER